MNIIKLIKAKKNIFIESAINLLAMLIFWGGMLRRSFNADTITFMVSNENVVVNLEDGRYVQSFFDYIYELLGFKTTTILPVSTFLSICLFSLSLTVIQELFGKYCRSIKIKDIAFYVGTSLVFLNVLYAELMMFGECYLHFGLGYFCASLGVYLYAKKNKVASIILIAIGACTYQYTVIYAAVILAFYYCIEAEFNLSIRLIVEEIKAVFICCLMGVINLLSIKLLVQLGVLSSFRKSDAMGDISQKVTEVGKTIIGFFKNSFGIFPSVWLPAIFFLSILAIIFIQWYKAKEIRKFITLMMLLLGSILLLYVIPVTASIFTFPPRMSFCLYLVIGLLIVSVYINSSDRKQLILSGIAIAFLLVQMLFAHFIVSDHFLSNELDETYIKMVSNAVTNYESENGIVVENICVIHDMDAPDYYDSRVSFHTGQINERVITIAPVNLFKVFAGKDFNKVSMDDDIYTSYFEGKNWDYFCLDEQVVIKDNTLYWCVF